MKNTLFILLFGFTLVFALGFNPKPKPIENFFEIITQEEYASALSTDIKAFIKQKKWGYKPSPKTIIEVIRTYKYSRDYTRIKIYEAFIEYEKEHSGELNNNEFQNVLLELWK